MRKLQPCSETPIVSEPVLIGSGLVLFQDRIELLLVEKSSLERSKKSLESELSTCANDKMNLSEALNKTSKESGSVKSVINHLEMVNKSLSKEVQDKLILIGQLERVMS